MTHSPLISVISVCYNSAETLARALKSVAKQDWHKIEHIIIDGESTDGTKEVIEQFKPLLAHVVSEADNGIYDAMNKGLDKANGDIICFLNSDDYYASTDVLSRVAKLMHENKLDALIGDVAFFHKENPMRTIRRYRSDRFTPERLSLGWMPAHPALFLRKEVFRSVGKFNTNYRIAGDFEFIVRAFNDQSICYQHIPEVLVRMQTGGASAQGWKAKLLLNKEVLQACHENGIDTNIFKILSKYPAKLLETLLR